MASTDACRPGNQIMNDILDSLAKVIESRKTQDADSSYVASLFDKGMDSILKKNSIGVRGVPSEDLARVEMTKFQSPAFWANFGRPQHSSMNFLNPIASKPLTRTSSRV